MHTTKNVLSEAVYYILLSLRRPLHGYGVIKETEKLSNGRVRLSAGTLYGALSNLMGKAGIEALETEADSRKKEYALTPAGKEVLLQELERLRELVRNGEELLSNY